MATESRPKKVRSPSYPAIDLESAIGRAEALYQKEKWHDAPIDVILSHWGYSPASGAGLVQLAALKKYGLLVDEGSGEDRKAKLSNLAREILIYDDEAARMWAIQEAAKSPTIYQEILNKYSEGLPSDATLRSYLIKEKDFNDNSVRDLISVMRKTFEFAKLGSGDTIGASNEDTQREPRQPMTQALQTPMQSRSQQQAANVPITVVLDGGAITVVHIPRMPEAAFVLFKSLLETYKPAIVVDPAADK